jgi:hypothetical protein
VGAASGRRARVANSLQEYSCIDSQLITGSFEKSASGLCPAHMQRLPLGRAHIGVLAVNSQLPGLPVQIQESFCQYPNGS